jgi:zinc transport system substrate-binding protein
MAERVVLASTSLVGAIAKAAGAKEVRVLTPGEVRHPPEYDLKPSDLLKFEGVDIVVYGGYERMVAKLLETSKNKKVLVIQIETDTSPESLVTQARKISKILKTEKEEQTWERHFSERLKDLRKKIFPFSRKEAVVHRFAEPFARWAGLSIVQTISPGELTPKVVAEAIAKKPELVVDIHHLPIAGVIAENAKCRYIQIINFPGIGSTRNLEDIFEYNVFQLIKAYR